MSNTARRVAVGLRNFLAEISYEVFLYIGLFAGLAAWWYFSSIYAGITVFVVTGVIFGGAVYWFAQVQEPEKRQTSPWPLIFIAVALTSGTVTILAWVHLPPIYTAIAVLLTVLAVAIFVYGYIDRAKKRR